MIVTKGRHSTWLLDAFLTAGKYLGYPLRDPNGPAGQAGFAPYLFNINEGHRWTTVDGYLRPALQARTNLHIALDTHVRRILFDDVRNKKNATGVVVSHDGGSSVFEVFCT